MQRRLVRRGQARPNPRVAEGSHWQARLRLRRRAPHLRASPAAHRESVVWHSASSQNVRLMNDTGVSISPYQRTSAIAHRAPPPPLTARALVRRTAAITLFGAINSMGSPAVGTSDAASASACVASALEDSLAHALPHRFMLRYAGTSCRRSAFDSAGSTSCRHCRLRSAACVEPSARAETTACTPLGKGWGSQLNRRPWNTPPRLP